MSIKVDGNEVIGDFYKVQRVTNQWKSQSIDWIACDVDYGEIKRIASSLVGNWALLSDYREACIRFQLETDRARFNELYETAISQSDTNFRRYSLT